MTRNVLKRMKNLFFDFYFFNYDRNKNNTKDKFRKNRKIDFPFVTEHWIFFSTLGPRGRGAIAPCDPFPRWLRPGLK